MDNLITDTISEADFGLQTRSKNPRSKVDYEAIASDIRDSRPEFDGLQMTLVDFRTEFWTAYTDKKKGHILWALKNVMAADVVAKLVTIGYKGSDAWVFIKPITEAEKQARAEAEAEAKPASTKKNK